MLTALRLSPGRKTPGPALGKLAAELGIRGLGAFGVTAADIPGIARKAESASSMRGNPIRLLPQELESILEESL